MTTQRHFQLASERAAEYGLNLRHADDGKHKYMFKNPQTGKLVRFGSINHEDYLTHRDPIRRLNYRKRHSKIMRGGIQAINYLYSPAWSSYTILWT